MLVLTKIFIVLVVSLTTYAIGGFLNIRNFNLKEQNIAVQAQK